MKKTKEEKRTVNESEIDLSFGESNRFTWKVISLLHVNGPPPQHQAHRSYDFLVHSLGGRQCRPDELKAGSPTENKGRL